MIELWQSLPAVVQAIIKGTGILLWVLLNVLFLVWLERKVAAWIQRRPGPNRVGGRTGLLQTLADGLKCITKEDIIPGTADRWLFVIAPMISVATAVMTWVVVPFGPTGIAQDLNIGIVYIAAVGSLSVVSVFMSGWGSDNKYSLLGAMRGAAQMISYEIALIMSIMGVVMMAGTLSLQGIVEAQITRGAFGWFVFPQIIGFIVFFIASLAETGRAPFDLMEAESELVAGYFTEYSSLRWLMFMLAEYGHLLAFSAIAATLFLGGWAGPTPADIPGIGQTWFAIFAPGQALGWVFPFFWFVLKTYVFIFIAMWIRWTVPRVRIDQLMDLGWKFLLPVSLVNVLVTGLVMVITRG